MYITQQHAYLSKQFKIAVEESTNALGYAKPKLSKLLKTGTNFSYVRNVTNQQPDVKQII